jgi:hypothetical protein
MYVKTTNQALTVALPKLIQQNSEMKTRLAALEQQLAELIKQKPDSDSDLDALADAAHKLKPSEWTLYPQPEFVIPSEGAVQWATSVDGKGPYRLNEMWFHLTSVVNAFNDPRKAPGVRTKMLKLLREAKRPQFANQWYIPYSEVGQLVNDVKYQAAWDNFLSQLRKCVHSDCHWLLL